MTPQARVSLTLIANECVPPTDRYTIARIADIAHRALTEQVDDCAEAVKAESDRWRRLPGAYRREDGGTDVIVDVPESASFLLDEFPDEIAAILAAERERMRAAVEALRWESLGHGRYVWKPAVLAAIRDDER